MSLLAGSSTGGPLAASHANGTSAAARFNEPFGAAADSSARIYVADSRNHRIRLITGDTVSDYAGSGVAGATDAVTLSDATFALPMDVAAEASGVVYVADTGNGLIRKIQGTTVSTLAGAYAHPTGIAVDAAGKVYVAERDAHQIRVIDGGTVSTLAGGGTAGYLDGTGTAARFRYPTGVAVDGSGNVYVADYGNQRIRKITAAGVTTTVAGTGMSGFANGAAAQAMFTSPYDVAVDASGHLYVTEEYGQRVRRIADGVVSTFAGSGVQGLVNGAGELARFTQPGGIAMLKIGSLVHFVVTEHGNHGVRLLTPTP